MPPKKGLAALLTGTKSNAPAVTSKTNELAPTNVGGRPSRQAKDKALSNKVWVGAAPTGNGKVSGKDEDSPPPSKKKRLHAPKGPSGAPIVVPQLHNTTPRVGSKSGKSNSHNKPASEEDSADESHSSHNSLRSSPTASSASDREDDVESLPKQTTRGRKEAMVPFHPKRKANKSPSPTRDDAPPPSTDTEFSDGANMMMDVDKNDEDDEEQPRPARQHPAQEESDTDTPVIPTRLHKRARIEAPKSIPKKHDKLSESKKDTARDRKYRAEKPDTSSKLLTAVKDMKPPKKNSRYVTNTGPEDTKSGLVVKSEVEGKIETPNDDDSLDSSITPGSRILSKRRQPAKIREILDEGIFNTLALFFFKDIYPDNAVQTKYCRDAVSLAAHNHNLPEVAERMAKDRKGYGKYFDEYVLNRVVNVRKETCEEAGKVVAPAYGLLSLHRSTLKELATELRKRDRCVYPLMVPDDYKTIDRSRPFQHPAVIQTLRLQFFTGSKAPHILYKDYFTSSIPEKPEELEVPEPMLILSVCAVHATLGDYITGEYIRPEGAVGAFTADAARAPYLACKMLLDKIRTQPLKYHALMHGLYLRVIPTSASTRGNTSDSDESDVDLDNMADDADGYTTNEAGTTGTFAQAENEEDDKEKQEPAQFGEE